MSSPTNSGNVDLESVLQVHRRRLASIDEVQLMPSPSHHHHHYHRHADTVYVVREEHSNSIEKIDSKITLFGELQYLCALFERFTPNILVYEDSLGSNSQRTSFSVTFEEDETPDQENKEIQPEAEPLPIVQTLRQTSISSQTSSPPHSSHINPLTHKHLLGSIGRSHTVTSTASDYAQPTLEGKRYGSIQLPHMSLIEVFEILFRTNLELVDVSSEYDSNHVLHQNLLFSKSHPMSTRFAHQFYSRP